MSKTVSGPMAAAIGDNNNLVMCFFVQQLTSGTIQGFTEHDKAIPFDLSDGNGEIIYAAAASFERTAVSNTDTLAVDNLEVEGVIDALAFTEDDIDAGKYDRALVKMFLVDWTDLTLGAIKIRRGTIGEITVGEKSFKADLRGMLQRYTEEILEVYTPSCRVDLGDTRCGVRLDPPVWTLTTVMTVREARDAATGSVVKPTTFNDRHFKCTTAGTTGASEPAWNTTIAGTTSDGSVTWTTIQALTIEVEIESVTDNRDFVVTYSGDAPDALLTGGLAKFITGENASVNMEVKSWTLSTRRIILFLPMPLSIIGSTDSFLSLEDGLGDLLLETGDKLLLENGDTVHIQAGCEKDVATCRDTFDNIYNFQGEPYVPGIKVLIRTPNAQ